MSSNLSVKRICEYCGNTFTAKTTVTRFCSKTCNSRHGKQRVRELKIKVSEVEVKQAVALGEAKQISAEFLSVKEASKLLGICTKTIYNIIYSGRIKAIRLSDRKIIIKRTEIDKIFEQPEFLVKKKEKPKRQPPIRYCYTMAEAQDKFNFSEKALYVGISPKVGKNHIHRNVQPIGYFYNFCYCGWIVMKIIKAVKTDKDRMVELLSLSFKDNLSVAFLTGSGKGAALRVRRLMGYAFEVCMRFGVVWMNEKKDACALVLYPHLKGFSFYGTWLDLKLLLGVIGVTRLSAVLKREKLVNALHPDVPFAYLWFIGVNPWVKGRGVGSELLASVVSGCTLAGLPVYLETSTPKNVPWYEKRGFKVFDRLDLGYQLYFLKGEG